MLLEYTSFLVASSTLAMRYVQFLTIQSFFTCLKQNGTVYCCIMQGIEVFFLHIAVGKACVYLVSCSQHGHYSDNVLHEK